MSRKVDLWRALRDEVEANLPAVLERARPVTADAVAAPETQATDPAARAGWSQRYASSFMHMYANVNPTCRRQR